MCSRFLGSSLENLIVASQIHCLLLNQKSIMFTTVDTVPYSKPVKSNPQHPTPKS